MKFTEFRQNPYLLFLPFLVIYIIIAVVFYGEAKNGDEQRYIMFAENLLKGYYSTPPPKLVLTSGPGYPILLIPFVGLKLPFIYIGIFNATLLYLAVIFLFKGLLEIVKYKYALYISICWALYINNFDYIHMIMTESLVIFLISLFGFSVIRALTIDNSKNNKYYLILAGFTLGYIVLTKFSFGYVLLLMIVGNVVLLIMNRKSIYYRKGMIILIISLAVNAPYLHYTYNLTGKMFYWGTPVGDSFYWMSTPFKGEYGDWRPIYGGSDDKNTLILNHQKDFEKLSKKGEINEAMDDNILKQLAINNIKSHPLKYFKNYISNLGRMLFNFPFSYSLQNPYLLVRIPQNALLSFGLLFTFIPAYLNWNKIPYSLRFMLFIILMYLGGSSLASAETRMFTIAVPILLIWMAYIIPKTITVNLKFKANSKCVED